MKRSRTRPTEVFWKFKGLYPDEEVWLMSEAVKREEEEKEADDMANSTISVRMEPGRLANLPIEAVLRTLTRDELILFRNILGILDHDYRDEIPDVERVFVALEYVKYLRWLTYTFTTPPQQLRQAQVAYEKTVGDKMMAIFTRLNNLRREKDEKSEKIIDFVAELLPEGDVSLKKVKYVEGKAKAAEKESD